MSARRLRPGNEQRRVFFHRRVDREGTALTRDIYRKIGEVKASREPRLPPSGGSFDPGAGGVIADEIFLAHQGVGGGIERGGSCADLLSISLDDVVERRRLNPECDFGELLRFAAVRVVPHHHCHPAQP